MVALGGGNRVAQAVVYSGGVCRALRAGMVFAFLCGAQSPRDVWASVVVLEGAGSTA